MFGIGDWKLEGDDWVHYNVGGQEDDRRKRNRLPDGSQMETFATYKATLLRDYPLESLSTGDEVAVQEVPGGYLYLLDKEGGGFEDDATPSVEFDFVQPVEKLSEGMDLSELQIRQGVDLIQEMIDADPALDIDFDEAKTRVFLDDRETTSEDGCIVVYDKSMYGKRFDFEDLLELVKRKDIPGVEIHGETVLELIKIAFETYRLNRSPSTTDEQRNRLAQRIHDLLEPLRLM